jgi:hypothetical protein
MQLDLTGAAAATRLELAFELWLGFTDGTDSGLFIRLLAPDGAGTKAVPVFGATGVAGRWAYPHRQLDLTSLVDIESPTDVYDLRGTRSILEWTAIAAQGAPPAGGVFIDDVNLIWEPDPAVPTPTLRPTSTPAPTRTATATLAATSTSTIQPTRPPAYLPVAGNRWAARLPTPGAGPTTSPVPPTEEPSD